MACCRCFECILKLLNFILTLAGLSMIGYGIYLLVEYIKISSDNTSSLSPSSNEILSLGRPIFASVALSDSVLDYLPKAWFIYLFIGVGVIVFIISMFGCCGIVCRNTCCLSCYSFLIILLILLELGAAGFIFFDESWKDVIPTDKTGEFDTIYDFLDDNWKIAKWVALGVVIYEALLFLLALGVRAANKPTDYDSDEEFINPRLRQPLIRQTGPPAGAPGVPTLDARPSQRNDARSQRMREKYGLDTNEFSYNPSDPSRYQQPPPPPAEEKGGCTIM
ncbi:hypothetical protein LUZ60_014326 [Juncus effusus]|nr:hypothetical protein LUZ60_014326 [Juncus effusus]